jgi:hypothetical protein
MRQTKTSTAEGHPWENKNFGRIPSFDPSISTGATSFPFSGPTSGR